MFGIPIHGFDRLTRGTGEMVHRAIGRLPIVEQDGPDLTRSAAGRLVSEMVWAPAVAVGPEVRWKPVDEHSALALLPYCRDTLEVRITTADSGALRRSPLIDGPAWAVAPTDSIPSRRRSTARRPSAATRCPRS
jgi:hypothetical protein